VNTRCMPMIMSEKSYCVWMCYLIGLDSVVSISANRFNLNFSSSDSPALWVQSSLCMPFAEFLLVCLLKTQIFLVWSPAKFLLFVYCVCMCVIVFLFLLLVLFSQPTFCTLSLSLSLSLSLFEGIGEGSGSKRSQAVITVWSSLSLFWTLFIVYLQFTIFEEQFRFYWVLWIASLSLSLSLFMILLFDLCFKGKFCLAWVKFNLLSRREFTWLSLFAFCMIIILFCVYWQWGFFQSVSLFAL